jgi:heme A synthase
LRLFEFIHGAKSPLPEGSWEVCFGA